MLSKIFCKKPRNKPISKYSVCIMLYFKDRQPEGLNVAFRPISVWSAANFLLNALLLVLLGSFCLLRAIKSPFDALIATLAGTIFIIVLITFAGFSSLSEEANKAAAGFAILFSVTALMIVCIILYLILTSDESSENQTETDSVPIEPIPNVTVNTIS